MFQTNGPSKAVTLARPLQSQETPHIGLNGLIGIMFFGAPHRSRDDSTLQKISRRAFRHWACEVLPEEYIKARRHQKYSKALSDWGLFEPLSQINSEFAELVKSPRGGKIAVESFCEGRPVYRDTEKDRDVYVGIVFSFIYGSSSYGRNLLTL